jgi:hypothetical protein
MKDIWYADKRDMVKWGGLINLCHVNNIKTIIQVAYFREAVIPKLNFNGKLMVFPEQVQKHFRNIENIKELGKIAGISIEVFKKPFSNSSRTEYQQVLIKKINTINNSKIVFLDPDNGLAPGNCKEEHVKFEEVSDIWKNLLKQDILVFYQHLFRKSGWAEINRDKLAEACSVKLSRVNTWSSDLAHDVVFYFVEKLND